MEHLHSCAERPGQLAAVDERGLCNRAEVGGDEHSLDGNHDAPPTWELSVVNAVIADALTATQSPYCRWRRLLWGSGAPAPGIFRIAAGFFPPAVGHRRPRSGLFKRADWSSAERCSPSGPRTSCSSFASGIYAARREVGPWLTLWVSSLASSASSTMTLDGRRFLPLKRRAYGAIVGH